MKTSSQNTIEVEVLDWLKSEGYLQEMRIAQVFKHAGFETSHFGHFIDPESGDVREIDIIATVRKSIKNLNLAIQFYVECKFLPEPWIIFTSKSSPDPIKYFRRLLSVDINIRDWQSQKHFQARCLSKIIQQLSTNEIRSIPFFIMPQMMGYQITSKRKKGNADNAYKALMQISKCIEAHDIEDERSYQATINEYEQETHYLSGGDILESKPQGLSLFCSIAFPLVVTNGAFFECSLDDNGEIHLITSQESVISFGTKSHSNFPTRISNPIKIVSEEVIHQFARDAYDAAQLLLSSQIAFEEIIKSELSKFPEKIIPNDIEF